MRLFCRQPLAKLRAMKLAPLLPRLLAATALLALPGCRAREDAVPGPAPEAVAQTFAAPKSATLAAPASTSRPAQRAGASVVDSRALSRFPYLQLTTPTSAVLVWNTRQPVPSALQIRRADRTVLDWERMRFQSEPVQQHVMRLTGLLPSTKYLYRVGHGGRVMAQGAFETARAPGEKFRIVAWGDSGVASSGQKKLARQIEKSVPDLLLHTGDLIYPRGEAELFDPNFFSIYRPTLARVPFYGALGNHDTGTRNGAPFLSNFVFPINGPREITPERCFSFSYADAHIAILDSNLSAQVLAGPVSRWLEADIKRSKLTWKLVAFHHPPLSSGLHGDEARTHALMPLFSRLKIDIVLNGHDHTYERSRPVGGVIYLVTGAGGAPRYPRRSSAPTSRAFANSAFSFTLLDFAQRNLFARQVDDRGRTIDKWSLSK